MTLTAAVLACAAVDDPVVRRESDSGAERSPGADEPTNWSTVFGDLDQLVLAGWAASRDEAFFVGTDGLVLRYQQSSWYRLEVPSAATLWWIWGTSSKDVYVGGEEGTLLHFDGKNWSRIDVDLGAEQTIWGIWGASRAELWIVGGSAQADGPGFILHGPPEGLRTVDVGQVLPNVFKVWGRSAGDVYVVGDEGLVIHVRDQLADVRRLSPEHAQWPEALFTVAGNARGSVLVVGGETSGLVFERDGSNWRFVDLAARGLSGAALADSGDAVVVGQAGTIRYRTAGGWAVEDHEFDRHYHAAVMMGETAFAVGGDLHSTTAHRRGLIAARGDVTGGQIRRVPLGTASMGGSDGGVKDAGAREAEGADAEVLDSGLAVASDSGTTDAGGADSGRSPIDAALPGPTELCTADLGCAAGLECWFVAGEQEHRCVTPCVTTLECPDVYGSTPQCAPPGCQTLTTVCLLEPWRGCF